MRAATGTAKHDLGGTMRCRDAASTLAWVRPMLPQFGITRLANVTGLDRIGIPVWMCIRPNGRSLSVSQGKGVTAELAQASAVMESIELYHAEHVGPRAGRIVPGGAAASRGPGSPTTCSQVPAGRPTRPRAHSPGSAARISRAASRCSSRTCA